MKTSNRVRRNAGKKAGIPQARIKSYTAQNLRRLTEFALLDSIADEHGEPSLAFLQSSLARAESDVRRYRRAIGLWKRNPGVYESYYSHGLRLLGRLPGTEVARLAELAFAKGGEPARETANAQAAGSAAPVVERATHPHQDLENSVYSACGLIALLMAKLNQVLDGNGSERDDSALCGFMNLAIIAEKNLLRDFTAAHKAWFELRKSARS